MALSSERESENYGRCHQALQLACAQAIPCIQRVLNNWHQSLRVKLKPCITPSTCPTKGKPKPTKGSCSACVDWGTELEAVIYPPNSSGTLPWSNINPTLLYADPIEAAKIFVLRLQPGVVYTDVGDFDSASLIMIMMKFVEFHKGDKHQYDAIRKIADIRNRLSHIKVSINLKLDDDETDRYFQDLDDFITCLSNAHVQCFPQNLAQQTLQTLRQIRNDALDIDVCQKELNRMYENEKGKITLLPFDVESTVDVDDVFVNLILERKQFGKITGVPVKSYDQLLFLKENDGKGKSVCRVLLKGVAGTGKTTLARKLAYDWAQGIKGNLTTSLNKFTLLFSIQMRTCDRDMSLTGAIFDQLLPSDSKVSKRGFEKYIVDNADKVVVILDGVDEFGGKIERSSRGDLILDVVCNKMLCDSCVVVTSRPEGTNHVKEFSQYAHVHLRGFEEHGILKFIGKFFQVETFKCPNKLHETIYGKYRHENRLEAFKDDFESELRSSSDSENNNIDGSENDTNPKQAEPEEGCGKESVDAFVKTVFQSPSLISMACVPVLLTMLCLLWQGTQKVPDRLTTLYQEFSHYFIQRWLEKANTEIDHEDAEATLMSKLGKVAAKCFREDRLFFNATELGDANELEKACAVGIIMKEIRRSRLHLIRQYAFFHRTFQEFYAAGYLVGNLEASTYEFTEFLNNIDTITLDSLKYVLSFCCGLSSTAARLILSRLVQLRSNSPDVINSRCSRFDIFYGTSWQLGMRFLLESQHPDLVEVMMEWLICDEINITIYTTNFKREEERDASFKFFISSLDEYVSCAGKEGKYSVISTEIIHLQGPDEKMLDRFVRTGPFWRTCSRSVSKIVNLLLRYSKYEYETKVKLNIDSDFDKTLVIAAAVLKRIAHPFNELHILFIRNDWNFANNLLMHESDTRWYSETMEIGLKWMGYSISRFDFDFRLHVSYFKLVPIDITPLLNGMYRYDAVITGFESNCVFQERVFIEFLVSTKNKLSELVILPPSREDAFSLGLILGNHQISSPFESISLSRLLYFVNKYGRLVTLSLYMSGVSFKYVEIHVAELFRIVENVSLHKLGGGIPFWKSVFRLLIERTSIADHHAVRNLCLTGTLIGGETIIVSDSPVYLINEMLCDGQFQRSLSGLFIWLSEALAVHKLGFRTDIRSAVEEFSRVLFNIPALEGLNLSATNLVPGDVKQLAEGLVSSLCLKSLNLSSNKIADSSKYLACSILQMTGLTELKLANAELGKTSCSHLGISLKNLQGLRILDLSGNKISFKGCRFISKGLQHLSQLRHFDMSGNPIGDMGVVALCAALPGVFRLEHLNVSNSSMGTKGILFLALSFQFRPNLKRLYIALNTLIGPNGISWLFEGIHRLDGLDELNLDNIELDSAKCDETLRKVFGIVGWKAKDENAEDVSTKNCERKRLYTLRQLDKVDLAEVIRETRGVYNTDATLKGSQLGTALKCRETEKWSFAPFVIYSTFLAFGVLMAALLYCIHWNKGTM